MHKKINVLKIDSFKENSVSAIHRLLTSCSIDDLYAGKTPLICWSIKYDDMSLLDLLLKSGANATTFQDTDLFLYAIKQKNEEAARMLLRYGASQIVNDANGKTSLEYAASAGLCGLMDALLSNYDQQTKNKALFAAIQNESFEAVEILLASGADLECRDSSGNTPLIAASNQTNEEVVSFMLKNGAKVNAANLYGETALHASAEFCSNKNITRYLLNRGADVNATTESGATALMYALDYEFSLAHDSYVHQVSYTLLERGADPDAPTTLGITPLLRLRMTDAEDGFGHRHGLLDTLLSFGANIQIQDSEGRNVIDYFLETEDEEALQIIADHIRERKTLRNLYDRIKPYDRKADAVFPNANLNKESALKKLGYSTSLSEFKRKELLKRTAIPQLGLSAVARHLAYLISRTQARKDSANYEQALNIWHADLLWLNREYSYTEDLAKYLNR